MKKTLGSMLLCYTSITLMATIIIPPANFGEMMDGSDIVIYGEAIQFINTQGYYQTVFQIANPIKGNFNIGDEITVTHYSGNFNGKQLKIEGDPNFIINENYLLFLFIDGSGNYKSSLLSYSTFLEGTFNGQPVLAHTGDVNGVHLLSNFQAVEIGFYHKEQLLQHLENYIEGNIWDENDAGYFGYGGGNKTNQNTTINTIVQGPCPNNPPAHCTTSFGDAQAGDQTSCTANTPGAFVSNMWDVCVASGAQTDPSNPNALTDLQNAVTTMNGMPGVNITYSGVGTCAATCATGSAADDALACNGGALSNPNKMWVFLDDPCSEIADLNNCAGILGIGGSFGSFVPALCHQDACGNFWQDLDTPFFVMNNGSGCTSNYSYTAVLIHEMLHAIGVGHIGGNAGDPGTGPNQCTALMNPVVCNANDPGAPDFGITALDNACTDWMYNPTASTVCDISNVMVSNIMCNGDDLTFDITFNVTDGAGTYDIIINGTTVFTGTAATNGVGETISVTATGPTAGGAFTVGVRDGTVFSCLGEALAVNLPACPEPCADNCTDLMSAAAGDCSAAYYPDVNTYPGGGTTSTYTGGDGTNCQTYDIFIELTAGSGNSHTICTQYTAATSASAFLGFFVAGDPNCIDQSIVVYDATTCTDVSTTGVTVNQPTATSAGEAIGLIPFNDYIVCYTYTENNCADDFSSSIAEICLDIIEVGFPPCESVQDAMVPADVCNGDDITVTFGPACMTDPSNGGANSGFGIALYVDPATGIPLTFPPGSNFITNDLLAGTDPNLGLYGTNSGGCSDLVLAIGVQNLTCEPIQFSFGIFNIDVVDLTLLPDCPIEEYIITIHPNYEIFDDITDGCDPFAGLFATDGAGAVLDNDGDGVFSLGDACFTAQLNPTANCTDGATLEYDFTPDVDTSSPGCYAALSGTLTCICPPAECFATAPVVSNDGGDCNADGTDVDSSGNNAPFTFADDGSANTTAPFITEYAVTDGPGGLIIGVFPTLAAAQAAANAEGIANGDACIQAINHDSANFQALIANLDAQTGGIICNSIVCPATTLEALYTGLAGTITIDLAILVGIVGAPNAGNTGLDLGALLNFPPGLLIVDVIPFCYEVSNEDCIVVDACPDPLCPEVTWPIRPLFVCAAAGTYNYCFDVLGDADADGITVTIDGVSSTGVAGTTQICVDIPLVNDSCDPVDWSATLSITCADGSFVTSPAISGEVNMVELIIGGPVQPVIYPDYTLLITGDDACGMLTAQLLAIDGSVCNEVTYTCAADLETLIYDFPADMDGCFTGFTGTLTCNMCVGEVMGCTDTCADNYDPGATIDDDSCNPYDDTCNADCTAGDFGGIWDAMTCACINEVAPVIGCTDLTASNYDPAANCDDGTCIPPINCDLAVEVSSLMCNDNGTLDDPMDDLIDVTFVIIGTGSGWTSPDAPVAAGNDGDFINFTSQMPGTVIMFTIVSNDDPDCIYTLEYTVPDCTVQIPTLSEWGLIIFALLLMTFGAIKIGINTNTQLIYLNKNIKQLKYK